MVERIHQHSESPNVLSAENVLLQLTSGEKIPESEHIAIVLAHQDDESIAMGAQFSSLENSLMVHTTDGAPDNPDYWQKSGFKHKEQYAHIRNEEVNKALDLAGHKGKRVQLGTPDQKAIFHIAEHASSLMRLFEQSRIRCVFTHAYEGGHPDHDATAVAVHLAVAMLNQSRPRSEQITIIEVPLYRMQGNDSVRQQFVDVPSAGETVSIRLSPQQTALKSMLYDIHRSQHELFSRVVPSKIFSTERESFRIAPQYDFSQLPNNGNLSRIFESTGLTPEEWAQVVGEALTAAGSIDPHKTD